jgi:hypothetical protein
MFKQYANLRFGGEATMRGVISNRELVTGGLVFAILFSFFLFPSPGTAAPGVIARPVEQLPPSSSLAPGNLAPLEVLQQQVYLPILMNCYNAPAGIYGHVTKVGVPASGIKVKLRLRNQTGDHDFAFTTTNTCGYYSFINILSISEGSGQGYFVEFYNDVVPPIPDSLLLWRTQVIQSYTTNQVFNIGDFDIGDVALVSPNSIDPLPLPVTFIWTKRSRVPSDSYIFYIYSTTYVKKYETPPLGYVSSITLSQNDLPPEIITNTQYIWYLTIQGPNDAYGMISMPKYVMFQFNSP